MGSRPEVAVGIIDSGVTGVRVARGQSFTLTGDGQIAQGVPCEDRLGHGTAVADIVLQQAPCVTLLNAQVFTRRAACTARQVAAALDWLASCEVQLVNMSFGLREDRSIMGEAVCRAVASGMILVASSPARGDRVWPAAYPQVISATGDARCAPGELSVPGAGQAEFGGHVRCSRTQIAGASVGCAHVSGISAAYLCENPAATATELRAWLAGQAIYHGPERRGS